MSPRLRFICVSTLLSGVLIGIIGTEWIHHRREDQTRSHNSTDRSLPSTASAEKYANNPSEQMQPMTQLAKFRESLELSPDLDAKLASLIENRDFAQAFDLVREQAGNGASIRLASALGKVFTVEELLVQQETLGEYKYRNEASAFLREHLREAWRSTDFEERKTAYSQLHALIDNEDLKKRLSEELYQEVITGASSESLLKSLIDTSENPGLAESTRLSELAFRDPDLFFQAVDSMAFDNGYANQSVVEALSKLSASDADAASKLLNRVLSQELGDDEGKRAEVLSRVIKDFKPNSLVTLFPVLESQGWPLEQTGECFQRLADFSPTQAADWIKELQGEERNDILEKLADPNNSLIRNPEVALAFIQNGEGLDYTAWDDRKIGALFRGLGRTLSASQLVAQTQEMGLSDALTMAALSEASTGAVETEPEQALALLNELKVDSEPIAKHVAQEIGKQWIKFSPEDIEETFANLDPAMQFSFAKGIAENSIENPEGAAQILRTLLTSAEADGYPTDEMRNLVSSIGTSLWGSEEQFVADWINDLPTIELREAGAEAFLTNRGDSDPVQLSAWLAEWPETPFRDRMASHLANLVPDVPDAALAWTATIKDTDQRRDTLLSIIRYQHAGGMIENWTEDVHALIPEEDRAWLSEETGISW